jgi:hypothetical protein
VVWCIDEGWVRASGTNVDAEDVKGLENAGMELTFRYGYKSNNSKHIMMRMSNIVADVSYQGVEGVIFVVSSCNRHRGFVATLNNRHNC